MCHAVLAYLQVRLLQAVVAPMGTDLVFEQLDLCHERRYRLLQPTVGVRACAIRWGEREREREGGGIGEMG